MDTYTTGALLYEGQARQYLRIKSDENKLLSNSQLQSVEEYPDCQVIREFRTHELIKEAEEGGSFYKWYLCDLVNINIDRTPSVKTALEAIRTANEVALCDLDEANEASHAEYETALCDIDENLNGGTNT